MGRIEQCFCDRCKEETKSIVPVEISVRCGEVDLINIPKNLEFCGKCRNDIQRKLRDVISQLLGVEVR